MFYSSLLVFVERNDIGVLNSLGQITSFSLHKIGQSVVQCSIKKPMHDGQTGPQAAWENHIPFEIIKKSSTNTEADF